MERKRTLEELKAEEEKIEQKLKTAQQDLRILQSKKKEQLRKDRVHRLYSHGAMLEQYLNPETFTDEQIHEILKTVFKWNDVVMLINDIAKRKKASE